MYELNCNIYQYSNISIGILRWSDACMENSVHWNSTNGVCLTLCVNWLGTQLLHAVCLGHDLCMKNINKLSLKHSSAKMDNRSHCFHNICFSFHPKNPNDLDKEEFNMHSGSTAHCVGQSGHCTPIWTAMLTCENCRNYLGIDYKLEYPGHCSWIISLQSS